MAVLLSTDLMVVSRVQGAATKAGTTLRSVSTATQAAEQIRAGSEALLVIDLSVPGLDIAAFVAKLEASEGAELRIIAFGPHVHANRLAAAEQAGCDLVVSRGQFFAQVDALLGDSRGVTGQG